MNFSLLGRANQVAEVNITEQELIGLLKEEAAQAHGGNRTIVATRLPGIEETELLKDLETHQVKFSGRIEPRSWLRDFLLGWMLPLLLIFLSTASGCGASARVEPGHSPSVKTAPRYKINRRSPK